jgi:hypothetical protein
LLIGSKTAKLHDIASGATRDAVVQIHFVTLLVLTSLGQVKKEWKPVLAPPLATQTINVGVRVAGHAEIRTILLAQIDFEVQRQSFRTGHAALLRLEPLSRIYRDGPFGDGSLFAKTLRRINGEQKAGH